MKLEGGEWSKYIVLIYESVKEFLNRAEPAFSFSDRVRAKYSFVE